MATFESDNTETNSEQTLAVVLVSIIKDHPVFIEKSQLPDIKEMKTSAPQKAKVTIANNMGKTMDEKQISKKIADMKSQVKKKTDANKTGNRKIVLSQWEHDLYIILRGDENPTISKMSASISAGIQSSSSTSSNKSLLQPPHTPLPSQPSTPPIPAQKRKMLDGETEDTGNLSLAELRRLALLQQLKYTRIKIKQLECQNPHYSETATSSAHEDSRPDITDLDDWAAQQKQWK